MNVSVDSFVLQRQPTPSSGGWHYWSLGHNQSRFFLWSNELSWVVSSLLRLAGYLDFARFIDHGLYPLEAEIGPNGGLVWYVHVGTQGKALALRRLSGSFQHATDEGLQTTDQTRYFRYKMIGQFPLQVWIRDQEISSGNFRQFAAQCASAYCQMQVEAQAAVGGDVAPPEVFRRVILTRDGGQRVPLLPGRPADQVGFEVVDRPLIELVLEHCQSRTTGEIATEIQHRLDEQAIRHLVPWTVRYDEEVLRGGYFFHVSSQSGQKARYQASRDKTLFLSDPVLASLVPLANPILPDEPPSNQIPVPQYERPPFDRARREGWLANDRPTSFGMAPTPAETRTSVLRRFAALPTGVRKFRWRILQLLDIHSAALCNSSPAGADGVLATQRVALLIADAAGLFAPETIPAESADEVQCLLKQAIDRYAAVLAGGVGTASARQPSALPKVPRTEQTP